jgi:2-polyprenyl-6-methoxyphenol hydroxylase-like FAD-dependent oxidoreductase
MKPITIIGGGLAGLTLGIGLRARGVPVTLWEASHYPRHRVCGEFISGRGQAALERLQLHEAFTEAGAIQARTAAFFFELGSTPIRPLPVPALCLSRFIIDALLAKRFRESGGELRENQRWPQTDFGEGTVRSSGRRLQLNEGGFRWFGLKVHAQNVVLTADLEMHVVPNGYVGLCRLHNEVNVCGLFRRAMAAPDLSKHREELLRGQPGTSLGTRLADAVFDQDSFCAVAGLALHPRHACAMPECCIGDALTMIPPVTGNGMSMAFESAELAIEPLSAYSRGEISWSRAREHVAEACDQAFAKRLAWAAWLQRLMFARFLQGKLGLALLRSDWLWHTMFQKTR